MGVAELMNVDWGHARGASPGVHEDPAFPQLENFHDDRLVLGYLREAFGAQAEADGCEVFNVWYIPRKSLQVVYRLDGGPLFGVRFLPKTGVARPTVGASSVAHLPNWGAIAWQFPLDPELAALPRLLPRPTGWTVLSYLPGERCAILHERRDRHAAVVAKLDRAGGVERTHRMLCRLWQGDHSFRMPRPLAADPDAGIRWEQAVEGRRFDGFPGDQSSLPLLRQVAAAAAGLHSAELHGLPEVSVPSVLRRIEHKVLPRIAAALPELWPATAAWFETLEKAATLLPARSLATVHGDLHTANVLLDRDGVILVDLDSLARGDPALDLALFGSRMLLLALRRGERLAETAEAVAELPDAYAAAGGVPIPEPTFAWYLSAQLVGRQVRTAIRHCAPDVARIAPPLLSWARETLESGRFTAALCAESPAHPKPIEEIRTWSK
jgi:streptomycin 6-kinase